MQSLRFDARNAASAFLGAFLGIFSCALIHPWAIPVGCIIGAAIGFHHRSILDLIRGNYVAIRRGFGLKPKLGEFPDWLRSVTKLSPIRTVIATRYAATAVFWLIIAIQWLIVAILIARTSGFDQRPTHNAFALIWGFGSVMIGLASVKWVNEERWRKTPVEGWIAEHDNRFDCFMTTLQDELRMSAFVAFILFGMILWFVVIGILYSIVVLGGLAIIWGILKGTIYAVRANDYKLPLAVCLVVTILAAWLNYFEFNDARVLWTTAIGAGLLSGAIAELWRVCFAWLFASHVGVAALAEGGLGNMTAGARKAFGVASEKMGTTCFESSVLDRIAPKWL